MVSKIQNVYGCKLIRRKALGRITYLPYYEFLGLDMGDPRAMAGMNHRDLRQIAWRQLWAILGVFRPSY
jgi:hypothetical protein